MDVPDMHRFGTGQLRAAVQASGAELTSIQVVGPGGARELLWQAGPQWPRHSPVLFPIVGRLADDTLLHDGQKHHLTQHGFARDRRFDWIERTATGCRLALVDDPSSRETYPYRFRLEIDYRIEADRLLVEYRVQNPGNETLPAALGAHPAFRWPLVEGVPKDAHRLVFSRPEPAPIRRVGGGLLRDQVEQSPVVGRVLPLSESLFADDAVILDRLESGSLIYEASEKLDAARLRVAWHGMTQLGLWSRAGADFLCI